VRGRRARLLKTIAWLSPVATSRIPGCTPWRVCKLVERICRLPDRGEMPSSRSGDAWIKVTGLLVARAPCAPGAGLRDRRAAVSAARRVRRRWDPLIVTLDGGYVHSSRQTSRKDGLFEAVTGTSTPAGGGPAKAFAWVQTYDEKPKAAAVATAGQFPFAASPWHLECRHDVSAPTAWRPDWDCA